MLHCSHELLQIVAIRALRIGWKRMIHTKKGYFSSCTLQVVVEWSAREASNRVKIETAKLLIDQHSFDRVSELIWEEDWIQAFLSVDEEFPIEKGNLSNVILETLWGKHEQDYEDNIDPYKSIYEYQSEIAIFLRTLALQGITGAIKSYGRISPILFLDDLNHFVELFEKTDTIDCVSVGLEFAVEGIHEYYFSSPLLCKGPCAFDAWKQDAPEKFEQEYQRTLRTFSISKRCFPNSECTQKLAELYKEFEPGVKTDLLHELSHAFDPRIREASTILIGKMQYQDAVPYLIEALNDQSWFVEKAAADALYQMGTPKADQAYEAWRMKLAIKDVRRPEFGKLTKRDFNK